LFVESYPPHTPWATCTADCPANAFLVLDSQPAFMDDVVQPVRELLAVAVLGGVMVSMIRRWRAATPLRRPTMGPVVATGSALIAMLTGTRPRLGLRASVDRAGQHRGRGAGLLSRGRAAAPASAAPRTKTTC
jgi:hypothetical protein